MHSSRMLTVRSSSRLLRGGGRIDCSVGGGGVGPRCAVADPGFLKGAPNPEEGAAGRVNLLFSIIFFPKSA